MPYLPQKSILSVATHYATNKRTKSNNGRPLTTRTYAVYQRIFSLAPDDVWGTSREEMG